MCYTGQCKYEGYMGDCLLINPKTWPDDAGCTLAEKGIEEYENSLGGNKMDCSICKTLCKDCKYYILAIKLMDENLTTVDKLVIVEEFKNKENEHDKTL